jgi:hypothetical protein
VQRCWDSDEATRLTAEVGLARKALLSDDDEAIRLIDRHEQDCAIARLRELIAERQRGRRGARAAIAEMTAADERARQRAVAAGRPADTLLFLFGRTFAELAHSLGYTLQRDDLHAG